METITKRVIVAPKQLTQSINSDIEYLRANFGADRKKLLQCDVEEIEDLLGDTLYILYIEVKVKPETNISELIEIINQRIECTCEHLEHKVVAIFLSGTSVHLAEGPDYENIMIIEKQVLIKEELTKQNIVYTPLLIDKPMMNYFEKSKILNLNFQRIWSPYDELTTVYIVSGSQMKFAIKRLKKIFEGEGFEVAVRNIDDIDKRTKAKVIILYNCETDYRSRKIEKIQEFITSVKKELGPRCSPHVLLMTHSKLELPNELDLPFSECQFDIIQDENECLLGYKINEQSLAQVLEKIFPQFNIAELDCLV